MNVWLSLSTVVVCAAAISLHASPSITRERQGTMMTTAAKSETNEVHNRALVEAAFTAWRNGTGSPFDLLADNASWTIVGRSEASRTYASREAFMRDVIRPFNARMREPLKPSIRNIYTDGDTVVVFFDAVGTATDGVKYENTYVWFMKMKNDRIVEAHAFFDSIAFNELWQRVPYAPR